MAKRSTTARTRATHRRRRRLVAGTSAFDPTTIANLVAWYDFSDIATLFTDTGRTTAVTTDAQVIKGVTDKSGSGLHLSEATNAPAYKASIQNGRSVARFTAASSQKLASAAPNPSTAQPVTVFVVGKANNTATTKVWFNGDATAQAIFNSAAGLHSIILSGTFAGVTDTRNAFHLFEGLFNNASSQIWTDGVSDGTGTIGAATAFSGLRLGLRQDGSSPLDGDIGEVLMYGASLSAANRQAVEAGLKAKWGTP